MRILIVEDHLMFRDVLRKVCAKEHDCAVVGEAGSAETAIILIQRHKPDTLLLDLGLPDEDGFAVARQARDAVPDIRILVISGYLSDYVLAQAAQCQVRGFVDKNTSSITNLTAALHALRSGRCHFSPAFRAAKIAWQNDPCAVAKRLSDTENRVFTLIARGHSDEEIAQCLGITKNTAATHRSSILRHLAILGTPMMAYAIEKGFGKLG